MSTLTDLSQPPSKIYEALERCLRARLVPLVRSSPAIGKSDLAHQLAAAYNVKVLDFRLGQADITDLNGLPRFTKDGRAEFAPFTDFPLEGDELPIKTDRNGQPLLEADGITPQRYAGWLLFFDELTSAPKQLQAASYKIILERKVGQRQLHPLVLLMAAGNLETDQAVVHNMSTALQSRLVHLFMRVDHKEWVQWAIKNDIDSRILAYLEFKPDELYTFKPDHSDHTFAAPRTWSFASRLIKDKEVTGSDLPLLAGTISKGVAVQFIEFVKIYATLPKIADIVHDPVNIHLPHDPSVKYALATMLAEHITEGTAAPLVTFARRLPVECRVLFARMLSLRRPKLVRTEAVQQLLLDLKDKLK